MYRPSTAPRPDSLGAPWRRATRLRRIRWTAIDERRLPESFLLLLAVAFLNRERGLLSVPNILEGEFSRFDQASHDRLKPANK